MNERCALNFIPYTLFYVMKLIFHQVVIKRIFQDSNFTELTRLLLQDFAVTFKNVKKYEIKY